MHRSGYNVSQTCQKTLWTDWLSYLKWAKRWRQSTVQLFRAVHSLSHPCVNFDLHRFYKDDTAPDIFCSMFYEIHASYDNFDHIYTDGSKMGDRVASAAICWNMVRSTRLPNNASIFRAELYAVTLAMYFVRRSRNSPTNHSWYQSSRVIALSCGIKISAVRHLVLSQCTRVTDGRTDGQMDRITTPKTALAYARAVIK